MHQMIVEIVPHSMLLDQSDGSSNISVFDGEDSSSLFERRF